MNHESDMPFVGREGKFGSALRESNGAFGIRLVVGVNLNGEFAGRAAFRGYNPQVSSAFVDDPFTVAADARPANALIGVKRDLVRLRFLRQRLAYDIGHRLGRGA